MTKLLTELGADYGAGSQHRYELRRHEKPSRTQRLKTTNPSENHTSLGSARQTGSITSKFRSKQMKNMPHQQGPVTRAIALRNLLGDVDPTAYKLHCAV